MTRLERIADLESHIDRLSHKIDTIRRDCPHLDTEKIAGSSTGGYDPWDDSYWYDCECMDCGKRWREDQ